MVNVHYTLLVFNDAMNAASYSHVHNNTYNNNILQLWVNNYQNLLTNQKYSRLTHVEVNDDYLLVFNDAMKSASYSHVYNNTYNNNILQLWVIPNAKLL